MIRWCLKRVKVIDVGGVVGQNYQKDIRVLEYLENGKWIEVPEVDERFMGVQP